MRQPATDNSAPETTHRVDTAALAHADARQPRDPVSLSWPAASRAAEPTDRSHTAAAPNSSKPDLFGSATAPDEALSPARLLPPVKNPPLSGWRRTIWAASGGLIHPGESSRDTVVRERIARVNQPLQGCFSIACLSLKGGVGKTTVTAGLGATLASLRGDRIVAVDANPDRGTLSQKVPLETTATVRHLLRDAPWLRRYSDVRAYTSQGPSRLEVLASESDPAVSEAFNETDYRRVADVVTAFFTVLLTDCGTGLMHSAMKGILETSDALVVVSSASIDGARSASATLDWLDAHGFRDLVARSITVINAVPRSPKTVDVGRIEAHFAARCRAVCRIPVDSHLAEGAELHLERLAAGTRDALLELAATVADGFSEPPPAAEPPGLRR